MKVSFCKIVRHFIEECCDNNDPCRYMCFVILDVVNNVGSLTTHEIDSTLLSKENSWIGTLITQHKGLNCSHDWNCNRQAEKAK